VIDHGPRTYRFTVNYTSANTQGETIYRQVITGDYTRGLPKGDVAWHHVTVANAVGAEAPFHTAQTRGFMEGFEYHDDQGITFTPDFFKSFPVTAVIERNLIWDTGMLEAYGQNYFDQFKLNEPFHPGSHQIISMPNVGTFNSRDTVLEWIGNSQRNGEDCALIRYQSFFNPLQIASAGMTLKGRSDYWGEIWVSIATKQIEFATLYESVVGEMKLPGPSTTQVINVFRSGEFAPIGGN
jgi:hypothetical protein